jgi:hypothetical protein
MSIFIGIKPFKRLLSNSIEIMNEFLMSSICYSATLVITDYLKDNEDRYRGAWICIGLISLTMFINMSFAACFLLGDLKLIIKKYFHRAKRYFKFLINNNDKIKIKHQ